MNNIPVDIFMKKSNVASFIDVLAVEVTNLIKFDATLLYMI